MSIRECVRCDAQTLKGVRCKKRTCMYSKFCNVHTKKLFNLYVKKSHIDGAGTGLYTSKMIPTNTRISQYTGELKRFDPDNISTYDFGIPGGMVIDASSTQAGIARYTNDCRAEANRLSSSATAARITSLLLPALLLTSATASQRCLPSAGVPTKPALRPLAS